MEKARIHRTKERPTLFGQQRRRQPYGMCIRRQPICRRQPAREAPVSRYHASRQHGEAGCRPRAARRGSGRSQDDGRVYKVTQFFRERAVFPPRWQRRQPPTP